MKQLTQLKNIIAKPKQFTADSIPVAPLLGIAVVVVIYLASMVLGQIVVNIYPQVQGWSAEQTNQWLSKATIAQFSYITIVEALTIMMLRAYIRSRKISFSQLGLIRPRLRDGLIAIAAYVPYFFLNAAATLGAVAVFRLNTGQQQQIGFQATSSTTDLLLTFVSLVILPPLVEEIVVRGFLFGSLKSRLPVVAAALLTSLVFASAHLQIGSGAPLLWVAAIDTFILSIVLCYVRQKTGSLWAGICLHALKNGLAFTVLFLAPHLPNLFNM